ncbi:MAG TPA: hypothetical protein VGC13_22060 [Longimicrobium sp.]|jgi:hypothetical protein|uniref:hypothetical protein n=1 Tax=Longimicrobium sp. TaxID=2029185 RepID=UPI002ED93E87
MKQPGVVPFRWDVRRREQLGRLLDAPSPKRLWRPLGFRHLLPEVRGASARVLARAGDARLVFVGRSPENLFDYLTGTLADTPWADRCALLSVSMGGMLDWVPAPALRALRQQHEALGLHPAEIASAPRPIAFVDLVSSGGTFGEMSAFLCRWARDEGVDVNAVRRRLRWVGITKRTRNSPNTWRWFQQVDWAGDYPRGALRGVSVEYWFWSWLGNHQDKTMPSNTYNRWGTEDLARPDHAPERLEALRVAYKLHEKARTRAERERFVAELVERQEMREPWLRSLVVALRRSGERVNG